MMSVLRNFCYLMHRKDLFFEGSKSRNIDPKFTKHQEQYITLILEKYNQWSSEKKTLGEVPFSGEMIDYLATKLGIFLTERIECVYEEDKVKKKKERFVKLFEAIHVGLTRLLETSGLDRFGYVKIVDPQSFSNPESSVTQFAIVTIQRLVFFNAKRNEADKESKDLCENCQESETTGRQGLDVKKEGTARFVVKVLGEGRRFIFILDFYEGPEKLKKDILRMVCSSEVELTTDEQQKENNKTWIYVLQKYKAEQESRRTTSHFYMNVPKNNNKNRSAFSSFDNELNEMNLFIWICAAVRLFNDDEIHEENVIVFPTKTPDWLSMYKLVQTK